MLSKYLTLAATALLPRPSLSAPLVTTLFPDARLQPPPGRSGSVVIQSRCDFDVYYANVPQQGLGTDSFGTIKAGGNYTVGFDAPQIGHSVKLSLVENNMANILQFEYSQTMDNYIDYDVSTVNGNPFDIHGFSLDADLGCPAVRCEVPVDGCSGVYIAPFGNMNPNFYCWLSANIGLTLCTANHD